MRGNKSLKQDSDNGKQDQYDTGYLREWSLEGDRKLERQEV